MTSYSAMSQRGGEAARETNQGYRLRTPVAVVEVEWVINESPRVTAPRWEIIGECGHVLTRTRFRVYPEDHRTRKRYRCGGCPR